MQSVFSPLPIPSLPSMSFPRTVSPTNENPSSNSHNIFSRFTSATKIIPIPSLAGNSFLPILPSSNLIVEDEELEVETTPIIENHCDILQQHQHVPVQQQLSIECPICFSNHQQSETIACGRGHSICMDCCCRISKYLG